MAMRLMNERLMPMSARSRFESSESSFTVCLYCPYFVARTCSRCITSFAELKNPIGATEPVEYVVAIVYIRLSLRGLIASCDTEDKPMLRLHNSWFCNAAMQHLHRVSALP